MKIVVLAGGLSPERDVSLSSGSLIANALLEAGHEVILLDIYKKVNMENKELSDFFLSGTKEKYCYVVPESEPDLEAIKENSGNGSSLIGEHVLELCQEADMCFMALHGAMGENGQLQATFDVLGISYTGTGYIGSLLAMDKDLSKRLMLQEGVPTAEWMLAQVGEIHKDHILNTIGLPCVVKPCSNGSSIGVSLVRTETELEQAIIEAEKFEDKLLIERLVIGREFSVGILGGEALPPIEIIPKIGFYDYKNKYQPDLTEEICPAHLTKDEEVRIKALALTVHNLLRLGSYSRIDFIQGQEGEFYCLEANTLPGMTPTSLLPQEALAVGISYNDLCNRIVELSI